MESLFAIGVGLVLRVVMDVATDNDDRVGGVLVGLWEGVVLNHFVRRMPGSFDPYLGFGFRIFVDFLFTQSLSRLALVALWSLVGMLLADISPNLWRDSGLRHLYRQVRRDVRHVKRAVPRIRVKNDLPSIRLFGKSRSASSGMSSSIRSDRASPARSRPASPLPALAPRRPGQCPPGTLPDVSGWSETDTSVSYQRERVVTNPGPSPALMPTGEHTAYERVDATRVTTSQTRTTTVQDATVAITQTQNESVLVETVVDTTTAATAAASTIYIPTHGPSRREVESVVGATVAATAAASTIYVPADDPSRHDPPTIPDDWVDVQNHPPPQSSEPVAPFQPDPPSTPESQPGPSTLDPPRPASVLGPPMAIDVLPDIPDIDAASRTSRLPDQIPLPQSRAASVVGSMHDQPHPRSSLRGHSRPDIPDARPPDQIPLPESRAASVIGGVYDQPNPRGSFRGRSRVDKTTSEIGVDSAKSLAPIATQTKSQSTSRSWFGSFTRSKLNESVEVEEAREEQAERGKSDAGAAAQGSEPPTCTPAQVDPPASILTQPKDATPLLLASEVSGSEQQTPTRAGEAVLSPADVNSTPTPVEDGKEEGSIAESRKKTSLFNLPSPTDTPPPPFSEFEGVPEGPAAGEAPAESDPLTLDETPTVLTAEQSTAEEKRHAFLSIQIEELQTSRAKLQKSLENEVNQASRAAKSLVSDIEEMENTLKCANARINKKKFSDPPSDPEIPEVSLMGKSNAEVQFAVTSAIMKMLSERDDAGPSTIQATVSKQKRKAKETKEVLVALVQRYKFTLSEGATPGIVDITF